MNTPKYKHLNRRRFLEIAALGGSALTANTGVGAAFRPGLSLGDGEPIRIDTHTHFYDPQRDESVPWPSKTDPFLYRTVLPSHYKALKLPQRIHGTVVVEASPWVEDNQWILDLASADPFIVGLVGNLPVGDPSFPVHLKRFARNPLFRGLRIGGNKIKNALSDRKTLRHISSLADHNLALDLLIGPAELPDAIQLARKTPKIRIILNHVANVRIDGKAPPQDWLTGMSRLAESSHVYCKVSALVEGSGKNKGDAPTEVRFYTPVLDHVWSAFGENRLVYGSNWPVSERFAPCGTVQTIVQDYFSTKGPGTLAKVFSGNASTAYRWVKRS